MNCRVLIRHSKMDPNLLRESLEKQFNRTALKADDWKSKSAMYKDLEGVENQLIWGSQDEGGRILYGVLAEDPTLSLIWVEYSGGSDRTFVKLRQIIANSASAIEKSQGMWRNLTRTIKVEQSELYEITDQKPLGIKIRIQTWVSRLGQIVPKDLIVPGITFIFALLFAFQSQENPASMFFFSWSSWSVPALSAWLAVIIWSIILLATRYCFRKIEVKFDV